MIFMLTDSPVSRCDAPQDEIKLVMAEQFKSVVTDFQETWSCMFLGDGRSRARLLSIYNWPPKLSLGYLMLKPHSEMTAGLVTSYTEAALQRKGSGMGTGEPPRCGQAGLGAAGLMPQNLCARNIYFPFQPPATLVASALSSVREAESAFG